MGVKRKSQRGGQERKNQKNISEWRSDGEGRRCGRGGRREGTGEQK